MITDISDREVSEISFIQCLSGSTAPPFSVGLIKELIRNFEDKLCEARNCL